MNRYHVYIIFWISALGILLLLGCSSEETNNDPLTDEQEESVEVRPDVIFAVADDRPIYHYVESRGVVEANRSVILKPKISGFIKQSHLVQGTRVRRGDTLLAFVDDEWQYALKEAQNEYKHALSEYKITTRAQEMVENMTGTNGKREQREEMIRITTGLSLAELDMQRARLNLSYAVLEAPFSGKLAVERRLAPGAYVSAGTEVATLIDDRTIRIRFDVLETEIGIISKGMTVQLAAPDGQLLEGAVAAVSPVVNAESKTGEVLVKADNSSGLLRPGMTIEGRILVEKFTGKVRIPRSAVLERDGGRTLLFKLHPQNNEVEWIYVEPLVWNKDWVLINHESIAPGDTLAVDKHFALSHLQIVEPKMQIQVLNMEGANVEFGN